MRLTLLLALLTGCVCVSAAGVGDGSTVVGRRGENVTLSCKYDIKYNGPLHVCWGRGQIPNSGCSEQLLYADGYKVTKGSQASRRYQLLGRLDKGDVSLTILNVSERDAGRYGCRVMIKGILNDLKYHLDLVVEEAPQTSTATTSHRETSTEHTTNYTTGHMTSTDRLLTSSSSSVTAEESSSVNVVLLCVLFGLVVLVTAGAVFIFASRRRRLNKIPQRFSSTPSTLQLQSRGSAVENIYQIDDDGDADRGEYEYCP